MRFEGSMLNKVLRPGSIRKVLKLLVAGTAIGVLSLTGWACAGSDSEGDQTAADTLTRRQKDSIIATLPIPGAGAVGKALDAADAAKARAERHDTIG